jgi:hypothetical protein
MDAVKSAVVGLSLRDDSMDAMKSAAPRLKRGERVAAGGRMVKPPPSPLPSAPAAAATKATTAGDALAGRLTTGIVPRCAAATTYSLLAASTLGVTDGSPA